MADPQTTKTDVVLKGEGLLTAEGRGVKNGVPYGEQLQTEQREVEMQRFRFWPAAAAKARAATRSALRR